MKLNKIFSGYQTLQMLQTFDPPPPMGTPFTASGSPPRATTPRKRSPLNRRVKVICAWCHAILVPGSTLNGVSHGICSACSEKLQPSLRSLCGKYVE